MSEHDEKKERFDFLTRQKLDLEEARDALRRGRGIVVELGASPDWFDEQLSKLN